MAGRTLARIRAMSASAEPIPKPEKELCSHGPEHWRLTTQFLCGESHSFWQCMNCGLPIDDPVSHLVG